MTRAVLPLLALVTLAAPPSGLPATASPSPIALVIHGGAGAIRPADLSGERETAYRAGLETALTAGHAILEQGGSALDAVEAAIRTMEDSPLFNAGKGAVFTAEGRNELDASIMVGSTHQAGAVASVTTIKNPITAARAVMEKTPHVLMVGTGAEVLAARLGLDLVEPSYFFTQRRWDAYQRRHGDTATESGGGPAGSTRDHGTVGAVALDASGTLAAGTSTGGTTDKLPGRVGDSPLIGAGTWAEERCAVSATGDGEYFIRWTIARDICARVTLLGEPVDRAADHLVHGVLEEAGGTGGVIVLGRTADGGVAIHWTFNTEGMFRGSIDPAGTLRVGLYADD